MNRQPHLKSLTPPTLTTFSDTSHPSLYTIGLINSSLHEEQWHMPIERLKAPLFNYNSRVKSDFFLTH